MTHYVGLDVSLRTVAICIVGQDGEVKFETKVPSVVHEIVRCLGAFDGEIKVVGLEAGTLTQYMTYGLQSARFEVVCMEARQVAAALSAMRNKTDKNDAARDSAGAAKRVVQPGTCKECRESSHPGTAVEPRRGIEEVR